MTQIQKVETQALATAPPHAPLDLGAIIQSAIASGRPMSELKEALDLAERMEGIRRESLFNAAFAAFKRECPAIVRRTQDDYITVTRAGVRKPRMYASLNDIADVVDPVLTKHGLTYDWTDAELTADGCIVRRFVLRHEAGHSRSTSSPPIPIEGGDAYKKFGAGRKDTSASPQQRMGVADTYAMRYSMISGLGLTTCDEDTDGRDTGVVNETITDEQARTLNDLIIELGEETRAKWMDWMKVQSLGELPASRFDSVAKAMNDAIAKRRKSQ